MSDYPISATLKGRSDSKWDAPWIVVYGNTPDEVQQRLDSIASGGLIDSLVAADNRIKLQTSGLTNGPSTPAPAPAAQPQASGPWQQPQAAPQQQAPQPSAAQHPEGQACTACNTVLQYKVVNRKSDGKQFKFWACPNQRSRDDGHTSVFA